MWYTFFIAIAMILWGAAWLPGGQLIEWPGAMLLLLNVLYRGIRFFIAVPLAHRYRQPMPRRPGLVGRPYLSAVILLLLGLALGANLPVHVTLALTRPRLYRMWGVDPCPRERLHNQLVGPLYVRQGEVTPNHIYLWVAYCGVVEYDPIKDTLDWTPVSVRDLRFDWQASSWR